MNLTEEQINRYARHILLPEVGGARDKARLLNARVLIDRRRRPGLADAALLPGARPESGPWASSTTTPST